MSSVALRLENVSKRYRINTGQARRGLSGTGIASAFRSALRGSHWSRPRRREQADFWALDDVSLEIAQGDVTGVIGSNGAGKSTLLKIVSGITRPTLGRASVFGRVGSLLEVGTGFHLELTGRENVYLNGAILGMRRSEVARKFDEIVDFAGVEQFLDTPVKRYSSGMYMRLAFAVAAHLETEILVVDEVLAVGDVAFQKKCLGMMGRAAHDGRTILFVSHSMPVIQALCRRVILLDRGRVMDDGPATKVIGRYLESQHRLETTPLWERQDRRGTGAVRSESIRIESLDEDGVIRPDSRLRFTLAYQSDRPVRRTQFVISICDDRDVAIFLLNNEFIGALPEVLPPAGSVICTTGPINLTPGRCFVHVEILHGQEQADLVEHAATFEVQPADVYGSGLMPEREWVVGLIPQEWRQEDFSGLPRYVGRDRETVAAENPFN